MTVINTNVKSLISQNALIKNSRAVETAMEQLSTGKRINSSADDATGMAISNRMTSQIRGLDQAVRNANDGISLIQTVEGSLNEVNGMLQRMRELSIQSANDTNTVEDRGFLDMEFQQLKQEINRVAKNTQWNGMDVLNKSASAGNGDGRFEFQVGANANQLISIQLEDFRTDAAGQVNADLKNSAPAKAATVLTPAVVAQPQVSTLTLSGAYKAADTIQLDMGSGPITYTVKPDDVKGNVAQNLETIRNAIVSTAGIDSTLGVVLTSVGADKINFTGPTGVSFTPEVTTSIGDAGKATFATTTPGSATAREVKTLTLADKYQEGDVITLKNGTTDAGSIYTVSAADVSGGTVSLTQLATNIANKVSGNVSGTTASATGVTVVFTANSFGGPGTLADLTATVKNANLFATTQVALVATPEVSASAATAQVDELSISGSFDSGDKVKLTLNGANFEYTLSDADANSSNPNEAAAKGLARELEQATPQPLVAYVRSGSSITFTGNANGSPFTSNVTIDRANPQQPNGKPAGSLSMIAQSNLTTSANAQAAIAKLDDAIAVISESRANMGAVMNRLTFAADNLMNVAQNSTESRSRILDTDFAKASSELARTQIISQAATSVLAQANQSTQSVMQLLQG
jgi:flagellin